MKDKLLTRAQRKAYCWSRMTTTFGRSRTKVDHFVAQKVGRHWPVTQASL